MVQLQSHIAGRWLGSQPATALRSAINGHTVAHTHAEAIDFAEAVHHARTVGLPNLLKLDFQQRAERLKAMAKWLNEHKEQLYAVSALPVKVTTSWPFRWPSRSPVLPITSCSAPSGTRPDDSSRRTAASVR